MSDHTLNETMLAKECLIRLAEKGSVLHQVQNVLSQVAHSSVGLGEVLQDYARQTSGELENILRAGDHLAHHAADVADKEALAMMGMTLKATRTLLGMTPAAMLRNKAEHLGEGKLSRTDVVALADTFAHTPDVSWLLEKENCGQLLVASFVDDHENTVLSSQNVVQDKPLPDRLSH